MNMPPNKIFLFLFLLAAFMVWPFLDAYVNNPDSFQYIRLARYWSEGNWTEAVNGYWSPMISWILAPFLLTGKHPVILFKLIQLIIALVGFSIWCRIVDRAGSSKWLKLAAIPLFLSEALLTLTPDLLFVVLCLGISDYFLEKPVWNDRKRALIAGLIGGLLYLSKAFGFPLFIAFAFFTFIHHRKTTTGSGIRNLLFGLLVFSLVSISWIAPISLKYGHLTLSEAAAYNSTREVSSEKEEIVRLPILYEEGLVAPFGNSALSAWEEPMQSKPMESLDLFGSKADKHAWAENVKRNFLSIWYFDFRRQAGAVFLLMLVVFLVSERTSLLREQRFLYPMVMVSAVYIGYGLILYHARYSWICTYSMMLMGGFLLMKSEKRITRFALYGMLLLMSVLIVKRSVKEILFSLDRDVSTAELFSALTHPRETMKNTYKDDRLVFDAGENIRCIDGPFASRHSEHDFRPRYFSSLMVAERCAQPYLGQIDDRKPESFSRLKDYGIRYLLVWEDQAPPSFSEKPICKSNGVFVYRIP